MPKDCQQTYFSLSNRPGTDSHSPQKVGPCKLLDLGILASQNGERTGSYFLNHSVCDMLLWQPAQTNALSLSQIWWIVGSILKAVGMKMPFFTPSPPKIYPYQRPLESRLRIQDMEWKIIHLFIHLFMPPFIYPLSYLLILPPIHPTSTQFTHPSTHLPTIN